MTASANNAFEPEAPECWSRQEYADLLDELVVQLRRLQASLLEQRNQFGRISLAALPAANDAARVS
jgi:hypothetical protein